MNCRLWRLSGGRVFMWLAVRPDIGEGLRVGAKLKTVFVGSSGREGKGKAQSRGTYDDSQKRNHKE